MTEELCLLTRLRKWHAANLPDENSAYDPNDIKDMIPEVIDRIENLETGLRLVINHPVEQSKQWEVGCKEMQKVARIFLEGKVDGRWVPIEQAPFEETE